MAGPGSGKYFQILEPTKFYEAISKLTKNELFYEKQKYSYKPWQYKVMEERYKELDRSSGMIVQDSNWTYMGGKRRKSIKRRKLTKHRRSTRKH